MFLPPLEKIGRSGKMSTEVLTLHPTLNFLEFMAAEFIDLKPVLSIRLPGTCR